MVGEAYTELCTDQVGAGAFLAVQTYSEEALKLRLQDLYSEQAIYNYSVVYGRQLGKIASALKVVAADQGFSQDKQEKLDAFIKNITPSHTGMQSNNHAYYGGIKTNLEVILYGIETTSNDNDKKKVIDHLIAQANACGPGLVTTTSEICSTLYYQENPDFWLAKERTDIVKGLAGTHIIDFNIGQMWQSHVYLHAYKRAAQDNLNILAMSEGLVEQYDIQHLNLGPLLATLNVELRKRYTSEMVFKLLVRNFQRVGQAYQAAFQALDLQDPQQFNEQYGQLSAKVESTYAALVEHQIIKHDAIIAMTEDGRPVLNTILTEKKSIETFVFSYMLKAKMIRPKPGAVRAAALRKHEAVRNERNKIHVELATETIISLQREIQQKKSRNHRAQQLQLTQRFTDLLLRTAINHFDVDQFRLEMVQVKIELSLILEGWLTIAIKENQHFRKSISHCLDLIIDYERRVTLLDTSEIPNTIEAAHEKLILLALEGYVDAYDDYLKAVARGEIVGIFDYKCPVVEEILAHLDNDKKNMFIAKLMLALIKARNTAQISNVNYGHYYYALVFKITSFHMAATVFSEAFNSGEFFELYDDKQKHLLLDDVKHLYHSPFINEALSLSIEQAAHKHGKVDLIIAAVCQRYATEEMRQQAYSALYEAGYQARNHALLSGLAKVMHVTTLLKTFAVDGRVQACLQARCTSPSTIIVLKSMIARVDIEINQLATLARLIYEMFSGLNIPLSIADRFCYPDRETFTYQQALRVMPVIEKYLALPKVLAQKDIDLQMMKVSNELLSLDAEFRGQLIQKNTSNSRILRLLFPQLMAVIEQYEGQEFAGDWLTAKNCKYLLLQNQDMRAVIIQYLIEHRLPDLHSARINKEALITVLGQYREVAGQKKERLFGMKTKTMSSLDHLVENQPLSEIGVLALLHLFKLRDIRKGTFREKSAYSASQRVRTSEHLFMTTGIDESQLTATEMMISRIGRLKPV